MLNNIAAHNSDTRCKLDMSDTTGEIAAAASYTPQQGHYQVKALNHKDLCNLIFIVPTTSLSI